jgi:ATP-dependent Clp protease ATP-binding subunit ClpC
MLQRFTERARRAVVLATEEARRRRHSVIGPEHLLLGILQVAGDVGVHMLKQLRVSPETLRAEVEQALSQIPGSVPAGEPAFSLELKTVLAAALSLKRRLTVDPDLLLLTLLAEDHPATNRILRGAGADLVRTRRLTVLVSGFRKPVTEEEVRFIATSKWRVHGSPSLPDR